MKQLKKILFGALVAIGLCGVVVATPALALPTLPETQTPVVAEPNQPEPEVTPEEQPNQPVEQPETTEETTGDPTDVATTDPSETEEPVNGCIESFGKMGWIMCPGVGMLAKITDTIRGYISDFLTVEKLSSDGSSIHLIWKIIRDISNIVFILLLMFSIFSQVTQIQSAKFGLKAVAPRIAIVAILVNLSFYICAGAVDLSNILGHQLSALFTSVAEQAAASGAIGMEAIPTWEFVATGAVGAGAAVAGLAVAGGLLGIGPLLLTVLLGALVAIVAALFTLMVRQALVFVLVAIAPLAIVAQLLPNTDKFYQTWKKVLAQILLVFPMFAVLYGASQLAGWAVASSAESAPMLILGMAIQVVPLIMTPMLMRMSGTVLGKLNDLARKPFKPAQEMVGAWAKDRQAIARANGRALAAQRGALGWLTPHHKLAAAIDKHAELRKQSLDTATKTYQAVTAKSVADHMSEQKTVTRHGQTTYEFKRDHYANRLKAKGVATSRAQEATLKLENDVSQMGNFIGGYWDEQEQKWKQLDKSQMSLSQRRSQAIAGQSGEAFKNMMTQQHRKIRGDQEDAQWYANEVKAAWADGRGITAGTNGGMSEAYKKLIHDANFGMDNQRVSDSRVAAQSMSAIAAENKKLVDSYATLYSETRDTRWLEAQLQRAIKEDNNWQAAVAGMQVLVKRGDTEDAAMILGNNKFEMGSDMEKQLTDAMLGMKGDAAHLWAFSKATKILTAKRAEKRAELLAQDPTLSEGQLREMLNQNDGLKEMSFNEMLLGGAQDDAGNNFGLIQKYLSEINDYGVFKTQDRTFTKFAMQVQDGEVKEGVGDHPQVANPLAPTVGHLHKMTRAVIFGGVDGELLQNNLLLTLGLRKDGRDDATGAQKYRDAGTVSVDELDTFLEYSSAGQIAMMKSDSMSMIKKAYQLKMGWDEDQIKQHVRDKLADQIYQLNHGNSTARNNMNPSIKKWLSVHEPGREDADND